MSSFYSIHPPTLLIYIDTDDIELRNKYVTAALNHNSNIEIAQYQDSGFDLYHPDKVPSMITKGTVYSCDMKIKAAMYEGLRPVGYYMYPRSSLSKTPLRLANSVGIIDSGYRGNLCAKFDVLYDPSEWVCEKNHRLLQICSGTLKPFRVEIVDNVEDLNKNGDTERGSGGFGSTGKN